MKNDVLERVLEATRLTQAGRLEEATRLLQGHPAGAPPFAGGPPPGRAARADDVIEGEWSERGTEAVRDEAPTAAPDSPPTGQPAAWRDFLHRFRAPTPPPAEPQGKPTTGEAGSFVTGSYANAAGERSYRLYVPACYTGQPLPLIVMLHGCKQDPDDFARGTGMNALAEEFGCLVLYPAQASAANQARCWNWFRREDQQRGAGEPSILAAMAQSIGQRYAVDGARIYVAGLSAGGAMAAVLGVTHPDVFAAIGIHSGLACGSAHDLPSALAAMKGMPPMHGPAAGGACRAGHAIPTIVFHGDRDRTVHPRNGADVIERSSHHAAHDTRATIERGQAPGGHAYTKSVHRDGSGRIVLEHWLVHGGGHAWFGGNPGGSYTDPRGPDAAREMVRFFLQASLPTK